MLVRVVSSFQGNVGYWLTLEGLKQEYYNAVNNYLVEGGILSIENQAKALENAGLFVFERDGGGRLCSLYWDDEDEEDVNQLTCPQ